MAYIFDIDKHNLVTQYYSVYLPLASFFLLHRTYHMRLYRPTSLTDVYLVKEVILARPGPGPRGARFGAPHPL